MDETYSYLLAKAFADAGIIDAFIVTGGAIAPFTSALAEQARIAMHFMLNEQAAGVAAEAYGFYDGKPCLLIVTSGPGVTNCLTAVAAAYTNSSPVIVVSGQARVQDIRFAMTNKLRQVGNQHLRTSEIVSTFTKEFYEPLEQVACTDLVQDLMQKATGARPGPVWLSLPIDLQREVAKPSLARLNKQIAKAPIRQSKWDFNEFVAILQDSQKPAMLLGNGARDSMALIKLFAQRFKIPILTTWPALDLLEANDEIYVGRPGSLPSSWLPNKVTYHSDFLIIVGARLDLAQVGYNLEDFAKDSVVWRVDIDESELQRFVGSNWKNICSSAMEFAELLESVTLPFGIKHQDWWMQIEKWKKSDKLPGSIDQKISDGISTYRAVTFLSEDLTPKVVVTGSSGTCMEMLLQSWTTSIGQRVINSCGLGSMGFAIPAAIGVSYKVGNEAVLCIESDGSFAMSVQEINTIIKHNLNIKVVILDSRGYKSIFLSQSRTGQYLHGFDNSNGLSLPDISKLAQAHEIRYRLVDKIEELDVETLKFLRQDGPCILQIFVSSLENPLPRLISVSKSDGSLEAPTLIELSPAL